jgi:hypothetical protein
MPTASASNEGWIVQFTGTTDATYTHGYIYECKAQGTTPDETYAWEAVEVQAGGGGGGLPSQTGNAGKFLTTDGTDASWSDKPLTNTATGELSLTIAGTPTNKVNATNICVGSSATADKAMAIGRNSKATSINALAIGLGAVCSGMYAIQLGNGTNSVANTFKVANGNGNFEIMSADGTVPTARLAKVNTTVTLAAANWAGGSQTVSVTGMTATGIVFVNPDPSYQADYTSAGIFCTAQAAGTLTFTCDTTPSNDIDVVVVMM